VWLLFACVAVSSVHPGDVATQVVATQPRLDKNQAGFYRLKVGRVDVTALVAKKSSYGHTPGQVSYHLEDGDENMIFGGDTIHMPAIQFLNPEATLKFDVDSKAAARQRKKELEDAAKSRTLVAMPHMYFPGVGHVAKEGDHYRWIPIPYLNDAKRAQ
jgi:glyoxylase-like metal-dependent hydrolase (beta-lactamase superfamily II)